MIETRADALELFKGKGHSLTPLIGFPVDVCGILFAIVRGSRDALPIATVNDRTRMEPSRYQRHRCRGNPLNLL